jgi:hypothetical protein
MVQPYIGRITQDEAGAGFVEAIVSNSQPFSNCPACVRAAILPVQPGRRVTKTIAGYAPEVCGPNGWVPISDPFQDLSMVVAGVQGAFAPGGFLPITPGDSVIKLRCPRCQRGYDVHADFLPIDHSAKCPHCGTVSPALKSIGYNEPAGVF